MTLSETSPAHREASTPADLNVLRTFLAVYRAGSFTAAAAKLGLSQPTVTSQIRSLERQTSRQLFKRLPRGVEPTAFAHELATHVSSPLDALGAIGTEDGRIGARSAPVHVAGPSELLCTRVLPALAQLVADGVQLRVAQGRSTRGLRRGHADRTPLLAHSFRQAAPTRGTRTHRPEPPRCGLRSLRRCRVQRGSPRPLRGPYRRRPRGGDQPLHGDTSQHALLGAAPRCGDESCGGPGEGYTAQGGAGVVMVGQIFVSHAA